MIKEYYQKLYRCLEGTEYTVKRDEDLIPVEAEQGFEELLQRFLWTRGEGKQLFFAGNGGSAAIAEHMQADFLKNGGMNTVCLSAAPLLTCMGNDFGFDEIYAYPVGRLGTDGDLLVTVSSSGNSQDIIKAIHAARQRKMNVITLSGFRPDNQSRALGDLNIYVPIEHYGIVESVHNLLLQQLVDTLMEREEDING